MLYDTILAQYNLIIADSILLGKIQLIGFTFYLPSTTYNMHSVPGEIDVLLNGETINQLHVLKSVADVTAFISAYG